MKAQILKKLVGTRKFLCITIHFKDSQKAYRALEVSQDGNKLSLINSFYTEDPDELLVKIPKNTPTILALTGQGIITKKVENIPNYQSKLLFNARMEDFYWYEIAREEHLFVSVIRKRNLLAEIERLEAGKIAIVDVCIGPFVATRLKPLLPDLKSLFTPEYELQFEGSVLSGLRKSQDPQIRPEYYLLGDEKISIADVIPFSAVLDYLYPDKVIDADKEFLKSKREEFRFKKAFNTLGIIALPFFLITLLLSYLMLGYYQREYMDLQVKLGEENIAYNKLVLLETDRKNKEAILRESGLNDSRFLSYYISEITKEIPAEIVLSELAVFPPQDKIKNGERIRFDNNLIKISGTVSSNQSFSLWIKKIQEPSWVENLEIMDFQKDGQTNVFEIRLRVKFDV